MTRQNELILGFPKEMKLQIIKEAMAENNISVAFSLAKILLDAPITKGGISTEEINKALQTKPNK